MVFRGLYETHSWIKHYSMMPHEEIKSELNELFHENINLNYSIRNKYCIKISLMFQERITQSIKNKPYLGKGE